MKDMQQRQTTNTMCIRTVPSPTFSQSWHYLVNLMLSLLYLWEGTPPTHTMNRSMDTLYHFVTYSSFYPWNLSFLHAWGCVWGVLVVPRHTLMSPSYSLQHFRPCDLPCLAHLTFKKYFEGSYFVLFSTWLIFQNCLYPFAEYIVSIYLYNFEFFLQLG
jgi:hypothetical protein